MATTHLRLAVAALALASCARSGAPRSEQSAGAAPTGASYTVRDTVIRATLDAAGVAAPVASATLSTKLMGAITAVLVREGDTVRAGAPLVRIDARDLDAKAAQAQASLAQAQAMESDAETHARRMRALYADSAAPRAQLDQAETGLTRAHAGVEAARAAAQELGAVSSYAVVRAPFDGVIVRRFVDPGAFAAPGAPLVAIEDASRLRIAVSAAPEAVRGVQRGQALDATIEHRPASAIVEGVVPSALGSLYTVNAIVDNRARAFLAGSAASLAIPQGTRPALLVPARAVVREGDLTGVWVKSAAGTELRWVRLGSTLDERVEVIAGVSAGDELVIPSVPRDRGGE